MKAAFWIPESQNVIISCHHRLTQWSPKCGSWTSRISIPREPACLQGCCPRIILHTVPRMPLKNTDLIMPPASLKLWPRSLWPLSQDMNDFQSSPSTAAPSLPASPIPRAPLPPPPHTHTTPPPPPSGTCQPTCRHRYTHTTCTTTQLQPSELLTGTLLSPSHPEALFIVPSSWSSLSPSSPPIFPTSLICITCSHPSRTPVGSHSPLGSSAWTLPPKPRLVAFPRNVLSSSITALTTQTYRTASTFLSFCPWLNYKLLDGNEYLLQSWYPNS